jgi:hypothetical protein
MNAQQQRRWRTAKAATIARDHSGGNSGGNSAHDFFLTVLIVVK